MYGVQRTFRAVKFPCNPVVVSPWHYTIVQTHRWYGTKNRPSYIMWTLLDSDVSV